MGVEINKNNNRPFSPFFEVVRFRWVRGCDFRSRIPKISGLKKVSQSVSQGSCQEL